jgi:outer membrane protein assembly factor BamB
VVTPRYCGGVVLLLALFNLGARPVQPDEKDREPQPVPILPAEEVWSTTFDGTPAANAWMDDQRVYVGLRIRGLRAVSRATGEQVWAGSVDITHPPLAIDDQLVIALPDELRALDPLTGTTRWARRLPKQLGAPLAGSGGRVFAADHAGNLVALRAADGEATWRHSFGAVCSRQPIVAAANLLVIALADRRVIALDTETGQIRWERSLPGTVSALAAARDRVLVGSTDNFLYALDPESGDERWRWRTGGDVVGAAAAGERVYFVSLDNVLRAVNRGNGNQLWKAAVPTRPSAPPIAFDDVVVLSGVAPRVDAYNGRTGAPLGTFTAHTELAGAPLIDVTPTPFEVAIVALAKDGRLTALRPTGLMFPDPPLGPLLRLPGRELPREPRPSIPNAQPPTTSSQRSQTPNGQLPTPNDLSSERLESAIPTGSYEVMGFGARSPTWRRAGCAA